MESTRAREVMREHQSGFVKLNPRYNAIDRLIDDSEKLEKIKNIINRPKKAYNYMMMIKDIKEVLGED